MIILNEYLPSSTNMLMDKILPFLSTLSATFTGAFLAFISQHMLRKQERKCSNIEGVNSVLITLASSLNTLGMRIFECNDEFPFLGFTPDLTFGHSDEKIPIEKLSFLLSSSLTKEQQNILAEFDLINHNLNQIRNRYVMASEIIVMEYRPEALKGNLIDIATDQSFRSTQLKMMIECLEEDMPKLLQQAHEKKEKLLGILKIVLKKKELSQLATFKINENLLHKK